MVFVVYSEVGSGFLRVVSICAFCCFVLMVGGRIWFRFWRCRCSFFGWLVLWYLVESSML